MLEPAVETGQQVTLAQGQLQSLFDALLKRGYTLVGPAVLDEAIVYEEIKSVTELPAGWTDEQDAATYRLKRRQDNAFFGYVIGPHSWKKFLFPSIVSLWKARFLNGEMKIAPTEHDIPQYAFIGVRSCELQALAIQDRVFNQGEYVDPLYKARREKTFVVAVNCVVTGGTCFCVSMKTGPRVTKGFDLALTEVLENDRHYFVLESGSSKGTEILKDLGQKESTPEELKPVDDLLDRAAQKMGRRLDTAGLKELLYRNDEHLRWTNVAERCLTCGNCTMVCPTCFCVTVNDVTDLTGNAERIRRWDSCFTVDYSYIHGGSVRTSPKSRYRQWMTHKLASWQDQFGTSGCVGCGRCITWCPVGIDITEEAQVIRESARSEKAMTAI